MNKVEEAFERALSGDGNDDKAMRFDPGLNTAKEIAQRAFTLGARSFSTMPLCKHGVAIWGVEHCPECLDPPGEFPGYNRPFDLPEHVDPRLTQDLVGEHEALRRVLLSALIKVGVLDEGSAQAPWDTATVLRFSSLWLADHMPWVKQGATHQVLTEAIRRLERRMGRAESVMANHLCDHEEKK